MFKRITYPDGTTINEDTTQRKDVTQYRITYKDEVVNIETGVGVEKNFQMDEEISLMP